MRGYNGQVLPRRLAVLLAFGAVMIPSLVLATSDAAENGVCTWTRHGSPYPLSTTLPTCPLPVDSRFAYEDDPSSYAPWSAPPFCPDLKVSSPAQTRHKPWYKPCLFTSSTFRGGAGLSLFTTPKIAASVAGSALDDSFVPLQVRSHPSSSMNNEFANVMYVSYDVRNIEGKGTGLVARRRIGAWDTVLVDSAALIVPGDFGGNGGKDARRVAAETVRRMVEALPRGQKREIKREIAGVRAADREEEENDKLLEVLRTHGFGIEIEEVLHTALYPLASVSSGLESQLQRTSR